MAAISHVIKLTLTLWLGALLAGCAGTRSANDILEQKLDPTFSESKTATQKRQRLEKFMVSSGQPSSDFEGVQKLGTGKFTAEAHDGDYTGSTSELQDISLNLVGASIAQAAKSVLGDVLEVNYSVDNRVTGAITLQTGALVTRSQLLDMFEAALRDNGATIVAGSGTYRVVPLEVATRSTAPIDQETTNTDVPGVRPVLVSLQYVSSEDMREVLEPMIPAGMIVRADPDRNLLILSGTPREVAAIKETISVFDVDWMQGMSFALVPVRSAPPQAIVQELEQVFNTKKGPMKGMVRFVPNGRLKSVLVISSRAKFIRDATQWIKKMDVLASTNVASLHVYHVQNRSAGDLAKILSSALNTGKSNFGAAQATVAPGLEPAEIASAEPGTGEAAVTGGPETPAAGVDVMAQSAPVESQLRIVADDANNSLLVFASDEEFDRIKPIIAEIDSIPNQVLLEAVIAEVSLDDDLKFGVRWFLGEKNSGGGFSDALSGAVSAVFPGFSYFLKANDVAFSLNALSSVTNVSVLSAPSLVVLDNKTATLQVGDQVPIVTQSAQGTQANGAPIVNKVELKDTGVILNVTPRVNDSGVVTLDIEQEVSSVVRTTTSGIDSPTIRQRKMKTSIVVNDGEALALGGLIQERENTNKSKIPVLGDVPILGAAFRQKTHAISRTELIIFIRPRVIRDMAEARQVTEEFRRQLSIKAPNVRRGDPTPGEELVRILN